MSQSRLGSSLGSCELQAGAEVGLNLSQPCDGPALPASEVPAGPGSRPRPALLGSRPHGLAAVVTACPGAAGDGVLGRFQHILPGPSLSGSPLRTLPGLTLVCVPRFLSWLDSEAQGSLRGWGPWPVSMV